VAYCSVVTLGWMGVLWLLLLQRLTETVGERLLDGQLVRGG